MTTSPLALLADRIDPPPNPYLIDPVGWVKHKTKEHMTDAQASIARALVTHRYVAVPSAHDLGKSFTASRIAAWWIDSHPPGEAFVVTTAPTTAQVRAILWRELGRAHRKGKLAGRITGAAEWKLQIGSTASELVAYGRKPADYDPAAFQGIHNRYVLVVIDEAGGVPQSIYDAVDALATNEHARVLAVGNPDDPSSHFQEVCRPGSGWHVIWLDALVSPNFTAEEVRKHPLLMRYMIEQGIRPSTERIPEEVRDLLVSPLWVEERLARWGADSPTFISKVRGRFPNVSIDSLIHPHWVELAKSREAVPHNTDAKFGVDVARYGSDKSIVCLRRGAHARIVLEIGRGPTTELAGHIMQMGRSGQLRNNPPTANVDDDGIGGGVVDILQENDYPVVALHGAARGNEEVRPGVPRFKNARSERWWHLRDALCGPSQTGADGFLDLDPDDFELHAQLLAPKYRINDRGQIEVETKDSLKKRGLASPDRADALAYSLVDVVPEEPQVPRFDAMITRDLLTVPL